MTITTIVKTAEKSEKTGNMINVIKKNAMEVKDAKEAAIFVVKTTKNYDERLQDLEEIHESEVRVLGTQKNKEYEATKKYYEDTREEAIDEYEEAIAEAMDTIQGRKKKAITTFNGVKMEIVK